MKQILLQCDGSVNNNHQLSVKYLNRSVSFIKLCWKQEQGDHRDTTESCRLNREGAQSNELGVCVPSVEQVR